LGFSVTGTLGLSPRRGIAYAAAIGVHIAVGYLSVKHLLPAFGGFGLMLLGLILSYPFLCRKPVQPL
jgi:hypothetical protein